MKGAAKLSDIGLVTEVGDTQSIVGTEGYLPPEGPGTARADVYSLGKVLYEISTGMDRRRFAELPEDLRVWPDRVAVSEFNAIVLKACAKNPAQRYESAAELRKDLELLQRGRSVRQRHLSEAQLRVARKVGLAAVVVLVAAAGLVALWHQTGWLGSTGVRLLNEDGTAGTRNVKAAEAYRLGAIASRRSTSEGFRQAQEHFSFAIESDPGFVAAQARLFEIYLMSEDYGVSFIDGKGSKLNALANQLMRLAPTNAEAHAAVAIVRLVNDWKWAEAEAEFKQALKIDPHCRMALTYYGYLLTRLQRADEARPLLERARQLTPDCPLIAKFLGHCEYVARDYERALQFYLKASDLEPTYPSGHYWAGRAYLALTNYVQGLEELIEYESRESNIQPWDRERFKKLRKTLNAEGARALWTRFIELEDKNLVDKEVRRTRLYYYAEWYARLGDGKRALEWLEKTAAQHQAGERLLFDEFWDPYRQQPKFKEILKQVGLQPWAR